MSSANEILGDVGEDEVRTFGDNLDVEITNRAMELGFCAHDLPSAASRGIVDLVLERAAELFDAYASNFNPGSAFMPFHVTGFLRDLKDDKDRFTPAQGSTDTGDTSPDAE